MRRKLKIKTGDIVKVIAGNQKGTQGKVLRVFADKNRAIVEGVNVVKKHNKPNANNPKGGITEMELSIDISCDIFFILGLDILNISSLNKYFI